MTSPPTPGPFRYGVLGAGMQGCAAGYDLVRRGEGARVTFFDRDPRAARTAADRVNRLLGADVAEAAAVDARDGDSLAAVFAGLDGVLSAAPYALNPVAAQAAVAARACFNDLGGNTDVVRATLALDDAARAAGVSVVPDCGLAPGLGNALAAHLVATTPGARRVRVRCGGLPQTPRPPLGYKLVFHVGGLTNEYTGEAEFLRGGRLVRVPTITELEPMEFAPPVGKVEAAVTSGGTSTAPETFKDRLDSYDYKTVRYPGHWAQIRTLLDLGLLEEAPVDVDGRPVRPRDVFHAVVAPRLRFPDDKDLVVLRVECDGVSGGRPTTRRLELYDVHDDATGFTAMERTTAFPAAAVLHFQVSGRIPHGAHPGERVLPGAEYLEAVRARGLSIAESTPG
ncbi:MAG TPA: saccharopine dehydrogenase C-terminal domain-containing protein [Planctomycetota bacterium]|nr:saccharopine dehydrogenase C-terminal domain-containing protein [Planctomycetota bacterium]